MQVSAPIDCLPNAVIQASHMQRSKLGWRPLVLPPADDDDGENLKSSHASLAAVNCANEDTTVFQDGQFSV